jgi:hypothetical protein
MKNVLVPEKTLLAFQVLPYLWLRHPLLWYTRPIHYSMIWKITR